MGTYDLEGVKELKKLLKANEDYWDEDLSVEFCIARRTRDILLGRKIVDDFVQSKRTAQKKLVLDFELEAVWQEYFKTYINSAATIADFWGIFISPSDEFKKEYSDIDEVFFPKVLEAQKSDDISDELKSGYQNLLTVFKKHRNTKFWENEKEWEWFFYQFLKYLTNLSDQVCRDGLGIFISSIIKMHLIVENSGWEIDYGLYDSPINVWGGQSLLSKFRVRNQAKGFAKRAISNLSWRGRRREYLSNRFIDYFFTYFLSVFFSISFELFFFLFVDAIVSSVFFILYGYWFSILQGSLDLFLSTVNFMGPETWRINTGLIGLNYMINEFIALQYTVVGRWTMLGIAFLVTILLMGIGILFDLEIKDKSSNPKTPDDISLVGLLAVITSVIIYAPMAFGLFGIFIYFIE